MIEIVRVEQPGLRRIAEWFVNKHHSYIRWADRPSRKLYWLILDGGAVVGVWGLGSCFARARAVSDWMAREQIAFNEVGHNIVYCLAGHQDRNTGSRALALLRRDAARWWVSRYGDPLKAFQTFILPPRDGAMYRADNWKLIGRTSGNSQRTETITPSTYAALEDKRGIRVKTFRSGEVKYYRIVPNAVEPKLILMRRA